MADRSSWGNFVFTALEFVNTWNFQALAGASAHHFGNKKETMRFAAALFELFVQLGLLANLKGTSWEQI